MAYRVIFSPAARDDLAEIQAYLTSVADADTATRFVDGIVSHALSLDDFPRRGKPRDRFRTGLRTLVWRGRVTIIYLVRDSEVVIASVAYGGRDLEELLSRL